MKRNNQCKVRSPVPSREEESEKQWPLLLLSFSWCPWALCFALIHSIVIPPIRCQAQMLGHQEEEHLSCPQVGWRERQTVQEAEALGILLPFLPV